MTTSLAAKDAPGVTPGGTNLKGNFSVTVEPVVANLGSITISQLSPLELSLANPSDRLFRLIKVVPIDYRPILPVVVGLAQFLITPGVTERYIVTVQPTGDIEFGSRIIDYTGSGLTNWFGDAGANNVSMLGDFNFVCGRFN